MKTKLFLVGAFFCFICGCMNEQEWQEWNRKQDQRQTEWLFYNQGVSYPGTREDYIKSHTVCTKEDVKVFIEYNAEKTVLGWLDKEDGDIKIGNEEDYKIIYLFKGKFDMVWSLWTAEEQEKALRNYSEMYNSIILHKGFMRSMTLEQLRVSLQVPLKAEYVSLNSAMYSWKCEAPNYSTDCTIYFTFIDDRLSDWARTYLPHIYETTYTPPIYYDKKHR